jgi:phytoene synthase
VVADPVTGSRTDSDDVPGIAGETAEPVAVALVHTMRRWAIPRAHVEAHLEALQAAPERSGFTSYADLERHLYGAAATIGLQVLPVLEPISPEAGPRARALAEGLQLITHVRDLRADMAAGRWYLPQDDLEAFALSREDLIRGQVTPLVGELLAFECERARRLLDFAEPGIAMLHPTSRDCVRVTLAVGRGLLETIAEDGYGTVRHRVDLPPTKRIGIVLPAMRRARAARRSERHWVPA